MTILLINMALHWVGGPIIKDKLHFFAVWDHQQDNRSLVIADIQSEADESRLGITKTTLDKNMFYIKSLLRKSNQD